MRMGSDAVCISWDPKTTVWMSYNSSAIIGFVISSSTGRRNERICSIIDKQRDLFEMMCRIVKGGKVGGIGGEKSAGEEGGDG